MKNLLRYLVLIFLSGCATEGYRIAEGECSYQAFNQYPVNNVTQLVMQNIAVQVPTGHSICNSTSMGYGYPVRTVCSQITRTEFMPHQQLVVIDTNKANRDFQIKSCAQSLCLQRFGNYKCDVN